jgi:hypothetical protein
VIAILFDVFPIAREKRLEREQQRRPERPHGFSSFAFSRRTRDRRASRIAV